LYGCNPHKNTVILHAGGGVNNLRYLNSQETFDTYYNQGYRYFEYDLKLSSDGRLIGTHSWENLSTQYPSSITYQEFTQLKLSNGYTPVNEEWLVNTIKKHKDIRIIVDAKMNTTEGDAKVLERIEQLETLYNFNLSSNIIPEVFSKEMWELIKDSTSFDKYIFSHYKVYYTVDQIIEYFGNNKLFWAVAIPTYCDSDFASQIEELKEIGKKILVFTPTTEPELEKAFNLGADMVYLDDPQLLVTYEENQKNAA
jgi:glycerophosphoryl diester phosphodiesterase